MAESARTLLDTAPDGLARDHAIGTVRDTPREKVWAVLRVASGNFLEMYDFMVFGY